MFGVLGVLKGLGSLREATGLGLSRGFRGLVFSV